MVQSRELEGFTAEVEPQPNSFALLFPGQGLASKDICAYFQQLRRIDPSLVMKRVDSAQSAIKYVNSKANFDISSDLENENSPSFNKTSFVQPIVYTLSVLAHEIFQTKINDGKVSPRFSAGHSLGEYAALTAASVVSFEDCIKIVAARGKFMDETCRRTKSELISIVGLGEEVAESVCRETETTIALINAPTFIVVGGAEGKFQEVQNSAKEKGARRVVKLQTAGAFHTHYMQEAAFNLDQFLNGFTFCEPQFPVIPNLTGQPSGSRDALRNYLVEIMTMPVRWAMTIDFIRKIGINSFYELGPGNSLSALNRANNALDEQTKNLSSLFL